VYSIKTIPEDFEVIEQSSVQIVDNQKEGNFAIFLLKKKNMNTETAVQIISQKIRIPRKNIGYAGLKDKKAVTTQYISLKNGKKSLENLEFKNFSLQFVGFSKIDISLGNLVSNYFKIVVRNVSKRELQIFEKNLERLEKNNFFFPNFFGKQRFSANNHKIGQLLVKKDFKTATEVLLKNGASASYEKKVSDFLSKNSSNFVGALRLIHKRILSIFVNSYQSWIFNSVLEKYFAKKNSLDFKKLETLMVPLAGFGTEIAESRIKEQKIINRLFVDFMDSEKISFRDFVIPQIQNLSSEGTCRKIISQAKRFEVKISVDDLNKEKSKIFVKFSLPKSSYATVFIDYLFAG